ncbi:MAG: hypothetical protein ACO3RV_05975 [Luteolibacter sp.]
MSTKKKKAVKATKAAAKAASTGIRYTEATKKKVVDFVGSYNAKYGRGGQSAAAKKFNVTQITVSNWINAAAAGSADAKGGKAGKKGAVSQINQSTRYSKSFKQEVVDFVASYNDAYGRGGQSQAAKKFKVSILTVAAWLRAAELQNARGKSVGKKYDVAPVKSADPATELRALKAALRKLIS